MVTCIVRLRGTYETSHFLVALTISLLFHACTYRLHLYIQTTLVHTNYTGTNLILWRKFNEIENLKKFFILC